MSLPKILRGTGRMCGLILPVLLSSILLVMLAYSWFVSYRTEHQLGFAFRAFGRGGFLAFHACRGKFYLQHHSRPLDQFTYIYPRFRTFVELTELTAQNVDVYNLADNVMTSLFGSEWIGGSSILFRVWMPHCAPVTILLLIWYYLSRRCRAKYLSSKRLRTGCCLSCGYDLRATPDRCPECGMVPKGIGSADSKIEGVVNEREK